LFRRFIGSPSARDPKSVAPVNLVFVADGWILERSAREIGSRVAGVSLNGRRQETKLTYFINYAQYEEVDGRSMALFTHREDGALGTLFDYVASRVDHAVAMCNKTEELVSAFGVPTSVIHMGTDGIRPLRFGICGRTYPTGRKGEHLVSQMVEAGYDVSAWGEGWPCPRFDGERDAFWNAIDYLVVTSTNEGGPVPVLEALARGVPVIAPDVGWCWEYTTIHYVAGSWASLKSTLAGLFPRTWAQWAADHAALFDRIIQQV
jgi:glycosyltransferase involved in cell wall biosynthesis